MNLERICVIKINKKSKKINEDSGNYESILKISKYGIEKKDVYSIINSNIYILEELSKKLQEQSYKGSLSHELSISNFVLVFVKTLEGISYDYVKIFYNYSEYMDK